MISACFKNARPTRFLARPGAFPPSFRVSSFCQHVSLSLVSGESVNVSRTTQGVVYVCVERCTCISGSNGTRFFFILVFFLLLVAVGGVANSIGATSMRFDSLELCLSQSLEKSKLKIESISLSFPSTLLFSSSSSLASKKLSSSSSSSSSSFPPPPSPRKTSFFFLVHRHGSNSDLGVTSFPFSSRITRSFSTTPFNRLLFVAVLLVFLVKLFLVEEECVEELPEEILLSRLSPFPPFFLLFSAALFFTTALLDDKEKEEEVSLARPPAGGAAVVVVVCDVRLIACIACVF